MGCGNLQYPYGMPAFGGLGVNPYGAFAQGAYALVGRPSSGMMNMPPTQPMPRPPIPGTPPGNTGPFPPYPCQPPMGYFPPGCSPCPPSPEVAAAEAMAYQIRCEQEQSQLRRATRAQILAGQPTIPLGIGTAVGVTIAANGGTATLQASPSVPICPVSFVIPRTLTPFFVILSMRIARTELLADGIGVPAETFAPDVTRPPIIEYPTLWPGTQLTLLVQNLDAAPHPFLANIWGVPQGQPGPCL